MSYKVFSKNSENLRDESQKVSIIAEHLKDFMATDQFSSQVELVHKPNGNSQQIQSLLEVELRRLEFAPEKKGLFKNYAVRSLRPDFYKKVGKSGILVEIERGKTIANNMDILDLWKCHLCPEANFLFMVVPCERKSNKGVITRTFDRVGKRMETFFDPMKRNYVNVEAVHLFGY